MNVANANGDQKCATKQELEILIRNSALNPYDDIWISEMEAGYPCLTMLVNGNFACAHYFLNENGDMWQSVGDCEQEVTFKATGEAPSTMPGNCVISLDTAIKCMEEFFDTHKRPNCIEWREL